MRRQAVAAYLPCLRCWRTSSLLWVATDTIRAETQGQIGRGIALFPDVRQQMMGLLYQFGANIIVISSGLDGNQTRPGSRFESTNNFPEFLEYSPHRGRRKQRSRDGTFPRNLIGKVCNTQGCIYSGIYLHQLDRPSTRNGISGESTGQSDDNINHWDFPLFMNRRSPSHAVRSASAPACPRRTPSSSCPLLNPG